MDMIFDGLTILWTVTVMVVLGTLICVFLGPIVFGLWIVWELFWHFPWALRQALEEDAHHRLQRHYK